MNHRYGNKYNTSVGHKVIEWVAFQQLKTLSRVD